MATSGSGFGGLTYALATNTMINNLGLPWAFRILAIITFVVNGVSSLLLRDRNKAIGAVHVAFHKDLFKRVEVWLYMIWGFFAMMGYIIVIFSLTDYAQQVGFTPDQGSIVAAMFNCKQHSRSPSWPSPKCSQRALHGLKLIIYSVPRNRTAHDRPV